MNDDVAKVLFWPVQSLLQGLSSTPGCYTALLTIAAIYRLWGVVWRLEV